MSPTSGSISTRHMLKVSWRPKSLTWACSAGMGARSQVARMAVIFMAGRAYGATRGDVNSERRSVEAERAPEDRLGMQAHPEALLDAGSHAAGEGGDVAGPGAVVADDGQGVTRGEADRPLGLPAREAGALDQPRPGEPHPALGLRPARDVKAGRAPAHQGQRLRGLYP